MGICKSICIKVKHNKEEKVKENDDLNKLNNNSKQLLSNKLDKGQGNNIQQNTNNNNIEGKLSNNQKSDITYNNKITGISNNNKNGNNNINQGSNTNNNIYDLNKDVIIDSTLLVGKATGNVNTNYRKIRKLGEGSYGVVYLVTHLHSNQERAMKAIMKREVENTQKVDNEIMNEIQILKKLDHPNIVKIFEFYNSQKYYYLITEYCKEGELFDKITKEGPFSEKVSSYIMYQVFSAVNYCHSMNIIHRDLKPENILIEKQENERNIDFSKRLYKIKIIDFGTAKIFDKNKIERKMIGSSYYMAPEVISKNYNEKCDLWSCGVILYILLSACPPFSGKDDNQIIESIKRGYYDIESDNWKYISPEAKNLIKKLLDQNVNTRLSAEEALAHPWFKKNRTKELFNFIEPEKVKDMLKNLQKYCPTKVLQNAALAYLVHNNPQNLQVEDAFKLFNLIDKNGNGKITKPELKEGLNDFSLNKDFDVESTVDRIFGLIDGDNNGYIEYEEFVRGCIDKDKFINDNIIKMSFRFFDKDNNGEITYEEIKSMFEKNFRKNKNIESMIRDIIMEVDTNKDGKISYEEFCNMMKAMLS